MILLNWLNAFRHRIRQRRRKQQLPGSLSGLASTPGRAKRLSRLTPQQIELLEERVLLSAGSINASADILDGDSSSTTSLLVTPGADASSATDGGMTVADADRFGSSIHDSVLRLAEVAEQRWIAAGISATQLDALNSIDYSVRDLGGNNLGASDGTNITIDDNAGGNLWFVDATPNLDEEFTTELVAETGTLAYAKSDLLTVLLHEQGHVLGLEGVIDPENSADIMNEALPVGQRRLPLAGQADEAEPGSLEAIHYLTSDTAGSSQPLSVQQAHNTLNYAIALTGIFPSQSLTAEDPHPEALSAGSDPFIGSIMQFAGSFAPSGWALAQGQLLSISSNTALFSLLGTTYGGDGSTTFGLPDLRGRVPVGTGTGPGLTPVSLGQEFGDETVALTTANLPAHDHELGGGITTSETGSPSPQSFDNRMPSLGLTPVVATTGLFPSQNADSALGGVYWFAGNFAPVGYAKAEGQLLSIAQNTALFSLLGTTYGGDGSTTFGLPDLRGRTPIHFGAGPGLNSVSLGQQGGTETVTLTEATLPSHTHGIPGTGSNTQSAGSDQNIDLRQPYLALNYQVALTGIFPSASLSGVDTSDENESAEVAGLWNGDELIALEEANALVDVLVGQGIERWIEAGISAEQAEDLASATYRIEALPTGTLASVTGPDLVVIDADASNGGWFVDMTPEDDVEFGSVDPETGELLATDLDARHTFDLLTTIMHEQGHLLGLSHALTRGSVMSGFLQVGGRLNPVATDLQPGTASHDSNTTLSPGSDFIAQVVMFAGNFPVRDYAQADGQLLLISSNTALFSLVGTTYGGDGSTTFGLPDLRGRAVVGVGQGPGLSNFSLGQQGGFHTTALSASEMPTHTHEVPDTEITLDGSNNLVITDVNGGTSFDNLTISTSGADLVITDPGNLLATAISGATGSGTNTVTIPLFQITGSEIQINTLGGDDTVTFDPTFDIATTRGVVLDAGAGTDTVNWDATAQLASLDLTAEAINLTSGTVNTGVGNQTFDGAVELGATTTLTGADVTFGGTVNSAAPATSPVVYEPFDYAVGSINGLPGGGADNSIGLTGNYVDVGAGGGPVSVTNPGLSFGNLDVAGNAAQRSQSSGAHGAVRKLTTGASTTLTGAPEVWFSILVSGTGVLETGLTSSDTLGSFGIPAEHAIGLDVTNAGGGNYTVAASARISGTQSKGGESSSLNGTHLIVGQVEFDAAGGDDRITLFDVNESTFSLGTAISTLTANVNHSTLDNVWFNDGEISLFDEIRFGLTSASVLPSKSGLTVNSSGVTTFSGIVGGTTPLGSLKVDSTGTSVALSADVTASGNIDIDPPGSITITAAITSTGGNVNLEANNGITLSGANADITTSGGTITIDADANDDASGVFTSDDAGSAVFSGAGNITVVAADLALTGTIAGTGSLTLQPSTAARTIGIGGGTGDFNVSDPELALLTDGFSEITIGDTVGGTGAVQINTSTFNDNVNVTGGSIRMTGLLDAGANNVFLDARSGNITGGSGNDVNGGDVRLDAAGRITDFGNNTGDFLDVTANILAAQSTSNFVRIRSANSLTIGTAVGLSGIFADSGVNLRTDGDITLAGPDADITTTNDNVILNADFDANGVGNFNQNSSGGLIDTGAGGGVLTVRGHDVLLTGATTTGTGGVNVDASGTISIDGNLTTNGGEVSLNSDTDGDFDGRVVITSTITTATGNIIIGGGADPTTTPVVTNLVNTAVDITGSLVTTTGNVSILAGDGSATGTTGFNIDGGGSITTTDGNVDITGIGSSSASSNKGIRIQGASTIQSTGSGAITLNGTGGSGTSDMQYGVIVGGGSDVSVNTGDLTVTGVATGGNSNGIRLADTTVGRLLSTGSGNITVTGTGNGSFQGIETLNASNLIGGPSATGAITLIADEINLISGTVQSTGDLTIKPLTAATPIAIGGPVATLELGDTELGNLADGFNSITIGDATAGTVTIDSSAFQDDVTVIGGDITITGAVTNAANESVTLAGRGNIDITADITTSNGAIVVNSDTDSTSGGAIRVNAGNLTSAGGAITLGGGANPLTTPAEGVSSFNGGEAVSLTDSSISSGVGDISVRGTATTGSFVVGVRAISNVAFSSTTGDITLVGVGGAGSSEEYGVILNSGSTVTTADGDIVVTGTGGSGAGSFHRGVSLPFTGTPKIEATGTGNVTVTGTGGTGASGNVGVFLQTNSSIEVNSGTLTVIGTAGTGGSDSHAVQLNDVGTGLISNGSGAINVTATNSASGEGIRATGTIGGAAATGDITLTTDTINLTGTSSVDSDGALSIKPLTASTTIGLGGGTGTLNLTDAELVRLQDGFSSVTIGGQAVQTLQFDGTNDRVVVADDPSLNPGTGSLTVETWFRTTSSTQSTLIAKYGRTRHRQWG